MLHIKKIAKVIVVSLYIALVLAVAVGSRMANAATKSSKLDGCEISDYGKTGKQLPSLFRDAIKSLPSDMPMAPEQMVYITDFDKFVSCKGFSDPAQINFLRTSVRGFGLYNDLPIYIGGYRQDVSEAVKAYDQGYTYARYIAASWVAHEYVHSFWHETAEVQPMQKELDLLQAFQRSGKLSAEEAGPWIQKAQTRLDLAWSDFRAGKGPIQLAISKSQ